MKVKDISETLSMLDLQSKIKSAPRTRKKFLSTLRASLQYVFALQKTVQKHFRKLIHASTTYNFQGSIVIAMSGYASGNFSALCIKKETYLVTCLCKSLFSMIRNLVLPLNRTVNIKNEPQRNGLEQYLLMKLVSL